MADVVGEEGPELAFGRPILCCCCFCINAFFLCSYSNLDILFVSRLPPKGDPFALC